LKPFNSAPADGASITADYTRLYRVQRVDSEIKFTVQYILDTDTFLFKKTYFVTEYTETFNTINFSLVSPSDKYTKLEIFNKRIEELIPDYVTYEPSKKLYMPYGFSFDFWTYFNYILPSMEPLIKMIPIDLNSRRFLLGIGKPWPNVTVGYTYIYHYDAQLNATDSYSQHEIYLTKTQSAYYIDLESDDPMWVNSRLQEYYSRFMSREKPLKFLFNEVGIEPATIKNYDAWYDFIYHKYDLDEGPFAGQVPSRYDCYTRFAHSTVFYGPKPFKSVLSNFLFSMCSTLIMENQEADASPFKIWYPDLVTASPVTDISETDIVLETTGGGKKPKIQINWQSPNQKRPGITINYRMAWTFDNFSLSDRWQDSVNNPDLAYERKSVRYGSDYEKDDFVFESAWLSDEYCAKLCAKWWNLWKNSKLWEIEMILGFWGNAIEPGDIITLDLPYFGISNQKALVLRVEEQDDFQSKVVVRNIDTTLKAKVFDETY